MSTIQRIGKLLRVGFGSAGAEIIRDNLERVRGRNEDVLFLDLFLSRDLVRKIVG